MNRTAIAFGLCLASLATFRSLAVAEEPASALSVPAESNWRTSTGDDSRVLAIRTNDFGGDYEVDQPIPVALELRYLGQQGEKRKYPSAQLHPMLDVWVRRTGDPQPYHTFYRPPIDNRIVVKEETPAEILFDLRKVADLSQPGEYRIAIGYEGVHVTSMGDWTGLLKSRERTVRIGPKTEVKVPELPKIEFPPPPEIELPDPPKIDLQQVPNIEDSSQWQLPTNQVSDNYDRVLAIRVSDFSGEYEIDRPVPVAVEILHLELQGEEAADRTAVLFPFLDVRAVRTDEPRPGRGRVDLPQDEGRRLQIERGKKFETVFDLRRVIDLSKPGERRVEISHVNGSVIDLGDWTGVLKARARTVQIRAKAADSGQRPDRHAGER